MKRTLVVYVILPLLSLYVAIAAFMYLMQERLQFFPDLEHIEPRQVGVAVGESVVIATRDGERLNAWYAPAASDRPTVLFFHGNAGSIAHRADRFQAFVAEGFGALFVDYRGFGGSTGRPNEKGLLLDAEASYDWLVGERRVDPSRLVVVGESLGTGVAVMLAARRPVAAVALEAAYSSLADVAAAHYWWLPVRLLIKHPFHADKVVREVKAPLLFIHGAEDEVIPVAFGRKLFEAANQPKTFDLIPGAGHMLFSADVFARQKVFFAKSLGAAVVQ